MQNLRDFEDLLQSSWLQLLESIHTISHVDGLRGPFNMIQALNAVLYLFHGVLTTAQVALRTIWIRQYPEDTLCLAHIWEDYVARFTALCVELGRSPPTSFSTTVSATRQPTFPLPGHGGTIYFLPAVPRQPGTAALHIILPLGYIDPTYRTHRRL